MRFSNYARKSVFSDTSDSTKNQQRMSKEYVELHFKGQVDSFTVYEDEDYTGANTNRPSLQRLMSDIKAGMVDVLIVYQLDRLSRDIKDFSNIYAILEEHNVQFISVKESIDTTTPIGKAMMYITVVFAQMERETIANRVNDNMIGLAKSGWWFGGNPPIGYQRIRITDSDGKNHVTLDVVPEDADYINSIFDLFLEKKRSLQHIESYFKQQKILTKNGKFFSTTQLHGILTSTCYVENTQEVYDFLEAKGCIMDNQSPREIWDGKHGIICYGRTTERNKKHQLNPPEKWRISIGRHKPFVAADKWLAAQAQFTHNVFDKTMKYDMPLLKGVLRCSCGTLMAVSRKKRLEGVSSWYYCTKRMRKGTDYCNMSAIKIDKLDEKVVTILEAIDRDPDVIDRYIASKDASDSRPANQDAIRRQIKNAEDKIGRLTLTLEDNTNSSAAKYIISEMERLDESIRELGRQLVDAQAAERSQKAKKQTLDDKRKEISRLMKDFKEFTPDERNAIARSVIQECTWDGSELHVGF